MLTVLVIVISGFLFILSSEPPVAQHPPEQHTCDDSEDDDIAEYATGNGTSIAARLRSVSVVLLYWTRLAV